MTAQIRNRYDRGDAYASARRPRSRFPSGRFFSCTVFGPLLWLWKKARQGGLDDAAWVQGSNWLAEIFENIGGEIRISGLAALAQADEPCVFIANHMSTLETFLLPGIIRPHMPVTFVVKKSLTKMAIFGPIMRSRDPVAVGRFNPREDLAIVLAEGQKRLANGISVIVFPQSTRSRNFEPAHFNSIGVKLALKAGAPIIPIALKTDAWGTGRPIKELARINPDLPARFHFGAIIRPQGRGKAEHAAICQFIAENVSKWQKEDGCA